MKCFIYSQQFQSMSKSLLILIFILAYLPRHSLGDSTKDEIATTEASSSIGPSETTLSTVNPSATSAPLPEGVSPTVLLTTSSTSESARSSAPPNEDQSSSTASLPTSTVQADTSTEVPPTPKTAATISTSQHLAADPTTEDLKTTAMAQSSFAPSPISTEPTDSKNNPFFINSDTTVSPIATSAAGTTGGSVSSALPTGGPDSTDAAFTTSVPVRQPSTSTEKATQTEKITKASEVSLVTFSKPLESTTVPSTPSATPTTPSESLEASTSASASATLPATSSSTSATSSSTSPSTSATSPTTSSTSATSSTTSSTSATSPTKSSTSATSPTTSSSPPSSSALTSKPSSHLLISTSSDRKTEVSGTTAEIVTLIQTTGNPLLNESLRDEGDSGLNSGDEAIKLKLIGTAAGAGFLTILIIIIIMIVVRHHLKKRRKHSLPKLFDDEAMSGEVVHDEHIQLKQTRRPVVAGSEITEKTHLYSDEV